MYNCRFYEYTCNVWRGRKTKKLRSKNIIYEAVRDIFE